MTTVIGDVGRCGRNDACPCGSGRKFKKCCGASVGPLRLDGLQLDARLRWRAAAAASARKRGDEALARQIENDAELLMLPQVDARIRLVQALQSRGLVEECLSEMRQARTEAPDQPSVANLLAEVLLDLGRLGEAQELLEDLLELHPGNVRAWCNLGFAHTRAERGEQAVRALARAIALRPDSAPVWNNYGSALQHAGRAHEALAAFQRAALLEPRLGLFHGNVARTLLAMRRFDDALTSYARQVAIDPRNAAVYSELLFAMNYSETVVPEQMAMAHRRFAEQVETPLRSARIDARTDLGPERRLRVGLVSADLRQHSVAHFLEPLLEHLDPVEFEMLAYCNQARDDAVTHRLRDHCAGWRHIVRRTDAEVARQIADDRIDILIDLSGHTDGNRLGVFARRPAPVQLTWLGYPNTTGLASMDYRLTDDAADPPGLTEPWHSERLWRLPECFVCYRPTGDVPPPVLSGGEPDGPIRFGSFNNHSKISPGVVVVWSRILRAIPGSRLVLKLQGADDAGLRESLVAAFESEGVDRQRVTVLSRLERADRHLERYGLIDIALDTFPYAGTTTTCDALWMGVPVVTLAGAVHASRVGASVLRAVGLPDLIAEDGDAYVRTALALASDRVRLSDLRNGLRARMAGSPLTNGRAFARDFGAALRGMWRDWCLRQDGAGHAANSGAAAAVSPDD